MNPLRQRTSLRVWIWVYPQDKSRDDGCQVAAAYLGLGCTWHAGLSASATVFTKAFVAVSSGGTFLLISYLQRKEKPFFEGFSFLRLPV